MRTGTNRDEPGPQSDSATPTAAVDGSSDRGPSSRRRGRRHFLAGAGAALTALSGCTFNVNVGGTGGPSQSTAAPRPATQTRTATATATPTQTSTATVTATPEPELVVLTVQPEVEPVVVQAVEPEPERYRLENFYLYVESASDAAFDGPNTEELYGEIDVSATDGEAAVETTVGHSRIWDVEDDEAREIRENTGRTLSLDFSPVEFVFPNPQQIDRSAAYIDIEATFWEADKGLNADEEFFQWQSDDRWYLDDDPSPPNYSRDTGESWFRIEFNAEGSEASSVNLSYDVTRV